MFLRPVTISGAFRDLAEIYADNNAVTIIGGRAARHIFLGLACADLEDCIRKNRSALYPIALAQAFAWFNCVAEGVFRDAGGAVLTRGMCEKYPADRCGYCQQMPCVCEEIKRSRHRAGEASPVQMKWTIDDWQSHLNKLYGSANLVRGIDRALLRLYSEVMEVGALTNMADGAGEGLETLKRKHARELTDVLAWIFALANLLEVDLEAAIRRVYGVGCPACKRRPCECQQFITRPNKGRLTHRFVPAEEIEQFLCETV